MCEMVSATMAVVSIVAAVSAGAYSAYAQRQQAKSERNMYNAQANLKRKQAQRSLDTAEVDVADERRKWRVQRGTGRAAAAASGMLVESDNVNMWEQDAAAEAEYDVSKIRENARLKAWGYEADAGLMEASGRQAMTMGNLKSTATLIGTVGSAANSSSSFANSHSSYFS